MQAPELNEPQLTAVTHHEGPLLVFAGAGSGKTRVITYRIAYLLSEQRVRPQQILAVTFTNKAAQEMRRRLLGLTGQAVVDALWVGTFHAVCARLLRLYASELGLERNYVIYDEGDQRALLRRALRDMGLDDKTYVPKKILGWIHAQKREGIGPNQVAADYQVDAVFIDIYRAYQALLKKSNAVDFEDLILHMVRLAESDTPVGHELRQRYDHVLVDEFQDTNGIQYRLIRALSARTRNLCVVGDDDQSIYSWRGANIKNIRGFHKDFAGATIVKLEQNYRSTSNIVGAALGVIQQSSEREPKKLWTDAPTGEPVVIRQVADERAEAEHVVGEIQRRVASGVAADEIAVFYRVNSQSRVLEEALRARNIAYQVIGGIKFFERAEVKDLLAYLRLIDNPRSDADLARIINVPARGIGAKTLDRLLKLARERDLGLYESLPLAAHDPSLGSGVQKKLSGFYDLVERLRERRASEQPSALAERVLEWSGYRESLVSEDNAESDARLENLAELLGAIGEYEREREAEGQAASLSEYLERVSLVSDADQKQDVPCVALMTVHSAKGLEFDTVFLTGMEDGVFPYRGLEADQADELEEERRLCYVALTRARRRLSITHATVRTLFGRTEYLAPSLFLSDIPAAVARHEGALFAMPWRRRPPPLATAAFESRTTSDRSRTTGDRKTPSAPPTRHIDYDAFDDTSHESHDEPVNGARALKQGTPRHGARVTHRRFGRGIVEQVVQGDPVLVVARFPGFGTRKILAKFLNFS